MYTLNNHYCVATNLWPLSTKIQTQKSGFFRHVNLLLHLILILNVFHVQYSLVPRPHPRGEGLVVFSQFLGLH